MSEHFLILFALPEHLGAFTGQLLSALLRLTITVWESVCEHELPHTLSLLYSVWTWWPLVERELS